MALSGRTAARLRDHLREEDLGKAATAVALALLTVLASLVAGLQVHASIEAGRTGRAAEQLGALAGGQDVSQVIQVGTSYGIYRRWFEDLQRAAWASFERVKATSDEQKAALDARHAADTEIAEWVRTQSPLLQPPYWDPALNNSDFARFEADRLVGQSVDGTHRAAAEQAVADAWGAKASEYVTVLTLVAVGLFFVGLAGTLSGNARRLIGTAGVLFGLVAIGWTSLIASRPIDRVPPVAIDHLVASEVALARAPQAAGTGGLTADDIAIYQSAISEAEAALAEDPDYHDALVVLAGARVSLADELIISGATEGPDAAALLAAAVPEYQRYVEANPEDASAWWNLGWASYLLGDHPAAIAATDRALELRPAEFTLYLNRSLARMGLGDEAGAVADVDQALQLAALDTTDTASWYLGQSDYDIGRLAAIHSDQADFLLATQLRLREAQVALRAIGRPVPDGSAPELDSATVRAIDIGRYANGRIDEGAEIADGGRIVATDAVGVRVAATGALEGRMLSARIWIDDLPRPEYRADVAVTGGEATIDLLSPYGRSGFDLDPGAYTLELYVDGSRRLHTGWVVEARPDTPQFQVAAGALLESLRTDGFDCPDGTTSAGSTIISCFGNLDGGTLQADITSDELGRLTYVVLTARSETADDSVGDLARRFFGYMARELYAADLAERAETWIDDQGETINDLELGGTTLRVYGATDDTRQLDIWAPWPVAP